MSSTGATLEIAEVHRRLFAGPSGPARRHDLVARPGHITVVLGPNGAGKSTHIARDRGLSAPHSGSIVLGDSEIAACRRSGTLSTASRFLPQGRSTFPELTVAENIELGGWLMRCEPCAPAPGVEATFVRYPTLARAARPAGRQSQWWSAARGGDRAAVDG